VRPCRAPQSPAAPSARPSDTSSIALTAASHPLFPAFVPARSIACSIVSVVSTPNAIGTPVDIATPHFDYVAGEAASGLQLAALETGVPVAFGLLTTDTVEQAQARVDKGAEAARCALEMADLFAQLRVAAASG